MIQSIQQFQTEGVKDLEKVFINYSSDMTKIAEMVKGVTDSVINLGLSMIAEEVNKKGRTQSSFSLQLCSSFFSATAKQSRRNRRKNRRCSCNTRLVEHKRNVKNGRIKGVLLQWWGYA